MQTQMDIRRLSNSLLPKNVQDAIQRFDELGITATYGGRKGHGFWLVKLYPSGRRESLTNDGVASGNIYFWKFRDAVKYLERLTPKPLHLHLKRTYFLQVQAGTKKEEYRLATERNKAMIEDQAHDVVILYDGYPPADDDTRRMTFVWNGFKKRTMTVTLFGDDPMLFYVIPLKDPLGGS